MTTKTTKKTGRTIPMQIDLRDALRSLASILEPKEKAAAELMRQAADKLDGCAGLYDALEGLLNTPPGTDPVEILKADERARAAIAKADGIPLTPR